MAGNIVAQILHLMHCIRRCLNVLYRILYRIMYRLCSIILHRRYHTAQAV